MKTNAKLNKGTCSLLFGKEDKRIIDRQRRAVWVSLLRRTPGFQDCAQTEHCRREASGSHLLSSNLSNIAAFGGTESPGCVHEKDGLLGKKTQKPCSEQFVSIEKKNLLNKRLRE